MTEERLDQLLQEMRDEGAAPEQVAAAQDRVWQKLAGSASLACAEFRPELGDYLAGQLSGSRRLLIDDHLGRCPQCRRVLAGIKGERQVLAMPQPRRVWFTGWIRWAVAASTSPRSRSARSSSCSLISSACLRRAERSGSTSSS